MMTKSTTILLIVSLALGLLLGCDMSGFSKNPAKRLIKKRCSGCHSTQRIYGSRKMPKEWEEVIERMIRHGATPTRGERKQILEYLKKEQGANRNRVTPAPITEQS